MTGYREYMEEMSWDKLTRNTALIREVEMEQDSNAINNNRSIHGRRIWRLAAKLILVCVPLSIVFFRCKFDLAAYNISMFLASFVVGVGFVYFLRSAEGKRSEVAVANWHAAREAHESLRQMLRERGLGGNSPSVFDGADSFSQALGSAFAVFVAFALGLVFTASRVFDSPQHCNALDIKGWGIHAVELVTWALAFAGVVFAILNKGSK